jgi:serine/threonine protein kinase
MSLFTNIEKNHAHDQGIRAHSGEVQDSIIGAWIDAKTQETRSKTFFCRVFRAGEKLEVMAANPTAGRHNPTRRVGAQTGETVLDLPRLLDLNFVGELTQVTMETEIESTTHRNLIDVQEDCVSSRDTEPRCFGPFEVLEVLGEGATATVYKARHSDTRAIVALKVLQPDIRSDPVRLKRFEQEFLVCSRLSHPNLVHASAFGQQGEYYYFAMEFVDGETLTHRIERQGVFLEAQALNLAEQLAQALAIVHECGFIHRDLKPENVLLCADDGRALLLDFGITKEIDANLNLTRVGQVLGSPHFMAPEQFTNARQVGRSSDTYGLGATLYYAITGHRPFAARGALSILEKKLTNDLVEPRTLNPSVSPGFSRALCSALRAAPGERPESCREFVSQLSGRPSGSLRPRSSAFLCHPQLDQRAHPRHRCASLARWRSAEGTHCPWSKVILVDVSTSGVGILTNESAPGRIVEIELSSPANSTVLILAAEVRRSAAILSMGMHRVGCSWLVPLTDTEARILIDRP